jgi:hypothetical protein
LVGAAQAEIELCWSTTGVSNPSLVFSTAQTDFLPYLQAPTYITQLPPGTYDLFCWGRFVETPTMPSDTQLYNLGLQFMGTATHSISVAYRQNKAGSGAYRRWDAPGGLALDDHLAAVTARGVEFLAPGNSNSDLYLQGSNEFLLGAVRITGVAGDTFWMELKSLGGAEIAMRHIGGASIADPPLIGCLLSFGPPPCTFQACCDLLVSNPNPLAGQTTTLLLRGGVTPTNYPCPWYGIGAMGGNFTAGAAAVNLPVSVISAQANIGYFGANTGSLGVVQLTPPLQIVGQMCARTCNAGGPGSIFGGCPLNNSAQDIYRFDFTVPAGALPGTTYTFTYSGSAYGIISWSYWAFNIYCPVFGPALPVGPCTATITVGGTPSNDSCGNCTTLNPGAPLPGTTVGATTDGVSTCGGTNDVWYCFTPTCPQPITVDTCLSPPGTDTVLSIHTACVGTPANEVTCNDDAFPGSPCFGTLQSEVTFAPTPNQTYYIRVATLAPTGAFTVRLTQAPAAPPSNDPCTAPLSVTNGVTPFSTCGATAVGPAGCPIQHDIWFRYAATCTGTIDIGLCGSFYNTALAVYTGPCSNLCQVACNDDNGPLCSGTSSSVSFYGAQNTVYLIRVGGNTTGSFGSGQLTIGCTPGAPANNNCASVTPIGIPGTYSGTTFGATPTPLLPGICGWSHNAPDVYYSFSTCYYGPVTINTCGSAPCSGGPYDTVLSVHSACPDSTSNYTIICNDDAGYGPCAGTLQSIVTFNPVPCQRYIIRVSGYVSASGNFQLNISQATQPPPNNACSAAIVVTPVTPMPIVFSNCLATTDGVGIPCGNLANDIWFKWTAPCSGSATIDTCGSSYDSVLAVYASTVCPPPAGSLVVCNDDSLSGTCGWLSSRVTFTAAAGTTYTIRIGGYTGLTGCGKLNISMVPPAPTCPPTTGGYCPPPLYFAIVGNANGTNWKWRLSKNCCFNIENCNVPGVPNGSPPAVLAAAFVASLNAACPPQGSSLLATPVGNTGAFQLKTRCAGCDPNQPAKLYVGHDTDACNALCLVTTATLATTGPCSFNPLIVELETSGVDCNGNDVDDLVDIALGTSLDANSNGVPDECEDHRGDMNCDGQADFDDINPFVLALSSPKTYEASYPECYLLYGDCNADGLVDFDDINPFVGILSGGQ